MMSTLPPSDRWYALEPKTNKTLDQDKNLMALDARVKEKGLDVVYSMHELLPDNTEL